MVGNHFELLIFLNIRTLELFETGLISLWSNWFEPNARPCWNNNNDNRNAKSNKKPLVRLSLTNLTGAFVVLAVGCLVSTLAFLIERIVYQRKKNQIITIWTLKYFDSRCFRSCNSCLECWSNYKNHSRTKSKENS